MLPHRKVLINMCKIISRVIIIALLTGLLNINLTGCSDTTKTFSLKDADDIQISLMISSFLYLGGGEETACQVIDKINHSEFRKTKMEQDFISTYYVSLLNDGKNVFKFSVDKNNIFKFSENPDKSMFSDLVEETSYGIISGDLNFTFIEDIFLHQRNDIRISQRVAMINQMMLPTQEKPDLQLSSNAYDYVNAHKDIFFELVAGGEETLNEFTEILKNSEEFGLDKFLMAIVCAEISGIGKGSGEGWASAKDWYEIYEKATVHSWGENFSMSFPPPSGAKSFIWHDTGEIDCKGCGKEDLVNYDLTLKALGYIPAWETPESMQKTYFKNNEVVQVLDQTYISESNPNEENLIRVSYLKGYSGEAPENRLSKDNAKSIIQKFLNELPEDIYGAKREIKAIVELCSGESFFILGFQIFRIYSQGYSHSFIVTSDGKHIMPMGINVEAFCAADIDGDEDLEFITIGGWGSGIFREEILVYKYDKTSGITLAYQTAYVPAGGYAALTLVKESDYTVYLYGADPFRGRLIPIINYGILKVDEGKLLPEGDVKFPFEVWG